MRKAHCRNSAIFVLVLVLGGAGCSQRDYDGDARYALSGKVSVRGVPVDEGTISFIPTTDKQRVCGGPIVNGTFTIPEERGANAGAYQVEVQWLKKTGRRLLDGHSGEHYDERKNALSAGAPLTFNVSETSTVYEVDIADAPTF